jgi:hypothetical protein
VALRFGVLFACVLALSACAGSEGSRYAIQWDATDQIWLAEESQVQVRQAQSRVFEDAGSEEMLEAVVTTFQDAGFQVEVLDEALGIVTGKKFQPRGGSRDAAYTLYDEEALVVFARAHTFRTWGPFHHRSDLVRLTVTVRRRNERQLVVRAAAQMRVSPIEEPLAYQRFFRALEQTLFARRAIANEGG